MIFFFFFHADWPFSVRGRPVSWHIPYRLQGGPDVCNITKRTSRVKVQVPGLLYSSVEWSGNAPVAVRRVFVMHDRDIRDRTFRRQKQTRSNNNTVRCTKRLGPIVGRTLYVYVGIKYDFQKDEQHISSVQTHRQRFCFSNTLSWIIFSMAFTVPFCRRTTDIAYDACCTWGKIL